MTRPIEWWCQAVFGLDTLMKTEAFSITFFITFAILTLWTLILDKTLDNG